MPLTKRCHIRWFDGAFQRDEERRVLSLRNFTSFRDVLIVPSNGKRHIYPWSLGASSTFSGRVRGDGPGERGCGSLWFLIRAADG